jgi:hypothetical protein
VNIQRKLIRNTLPSLNYNIRHLKGLGHTLGSFLKRTPQCFYAIFHLTPPFGTSTNLLGEQQDICGNGVELSDDILEC